MAHKFQIGSNIRFLIKFQWRTLLEKLIVLIIVIIWCRKLKTLPLTSSGSGGVTVSVRTFSVLTRVLTRTLIVTVVLPALTVWVIVLTDGVTGLLRGLCCPRKFRWWYRRSGWVGWV